MSLKQHARVYVLAAAVTALASATYADEDAQQSRSGSRATPAPHADETFAPIRQFDIPTTKFLGRAIYDQDQMAWKASDVLTGQFPMSQLVADKVHGWIVTSSGAVSTVRMIDTGAAGPEVYCDVTFSPQMSPTCVVPKDRTLSGEELALYTARQTALASITRRCATNFNTVVLKDPQRDDWLVWVLAATTVPGEVVIGGHTRFTISRDGKTVLQRDALSRGCLTQGPNDGSNGGKTVAMAYSQLVSPIPIETTVWLSLEHHLPIYVVTPDKKIWKVENDDITENATPPLPLDNL